MAWSCACVFVCVFLRSSIGQFGVFHRGFCLPPSAPPSSQSPHLVFDINPLAFVCSLGKWLVPDLVHVFPCESGNPKLWTIVIILPPIQPHDFGQVLWGSKSPSWRIRWPVWQTEVEKTHLGMVRNKAEQEHGQRMCMACINVWHVWCVTRGPRKAKDLGKMN